MAPLLDHADCSPRPKEIESIFILYRITGDESLRDTAWEILQSIDQYTSTAFGSAALSDVTHLPPPQSDSMESFWTAETLKYYYLIFSEPSLIDLHHFVFNTEAHPFKRPR
jgi:mannosyl-oligosaccharide alpha-1,2-mannosidase